MKQIISICALLLSSACLAAPAPTPAIPAPFAITQADNPYAPKAEDDDMQVGGVVLTSLNLVEQTEGVPARVKLNLAGSLPRTCDELRVTVAEPDGQYQIFVRAYSVIDPDAECENVFRQFEAAVLLGTYSAGRYTVWVNDELVGDFVSNQ